jgi:hypothetical protein
VVALPKELEMASASSTVFAAATRQRLIQVLRSPTAQKIDFYFGFLHVNGFGYQAVADAVSKGSIGVRLGQVPALAAAAFDGAARVFDFPDGGIYGVNMSDQANIVHEATHAMKWLIYRRARIVEADTQDEGAAYVAGSLYLLYNNLDWGPGNDFHHVVGSQVARSIMNKKGALVPLTDEARLRAAITFHPAYSQIGVTYSSTVYVSQD